MTHVEGFKVESDERGFELHICVDEEPRVDANGWMVLNCHSIAGEILAEVKKEIGPWWDEGQSARADRKLAFLCSPEDVDESGGYDRDNPKHPDWHSIHANIYDLRPGK